MTAADFLLDPRLAGDTVAVAKWPLCDVLLNRDARFVWLVLVPRRVGAIEIIDLAPMERTLLTAEIDRAAEGLRRAVPCDKLNIAALGNVVSQLHVHVIARRKTDAAWPKPVWNLPDPQAYGDDELASLINRLNHAFPA